MLKLHEDALLNQPDEDTGVFSAQDTIRDK